MSIQDLKGKAAIVTGAASGIGLGIARSLAKAGADVVLADIEADALEQAQRQVAAFGVRAYARRLDVSDRDAVRAAAPEFESLLGKVHLVFNNAGVELGGRTLESVEEREWDWIIGVNILGVINGIRHFTPLVRRHGEGGHVVNTASIGGFQVNREFRLGPYSMTKYAVVALSEALEQDLEGSNIGVSVLCPGPVNTRIGESARNRPERFGGPYAQKRNEKLAAALAQGMTGDEVGERVLRAIRDREFYIFTHREPKAWIEARFARILDAFSRVR